MFTINSIESNGVVLQQGDRKLRLQTIADNIIHINVTKRENFHDKPSDVILPQEPFTEFTMEEDEQNYIIRTVSITVCVNKETGALSYYNPNGKLLIKEPDQGGKTLVEREVYRNKFNNDKEIVMDKNADGMRASNENYETYLAAHAYEVKLEFEFADGECIWGLGSHEEGYGNLRGKSRVLYQENMKVAMPSFMSSQGYGFLLNGGCLMNFEDNENGSYIWAELVDELDYYIFVPTKVKNEWQKELSVLSDYDGVIAAYRKLTGNAPLLPKWAFGYLQSKERYQTAQEMIDVVTEYRKRKVPLDGIILDWMSWEGDLWGQKTFDHSRFPDPDALTETLHQLGAKMMISIWPIMTNDGPNQIEMKENGYLLGNGANYDSFNENARRLYWKQANEGLFQHGVDAWWCDCTEPFGDDWAGEMKPQPFERVRLNTENAKKYLDPRHILEYSFYHSMGIYEGMRATTNEKRVLNLTRSSFTGQCRYGTVTWSGDISAKWETLKRQIAEGLHFFASGDPYWTIDIGAFFTKNNKDLWFWNGDYDKGCEDEAYRELYVRWLQYATFLPMMRSHGTDTPREIWNFGEPGTKYYDTIEKYIRLRSSLVPYLYSLSAMVTFASYTFIRALVFEFPYDQDAKDIKEQFMFGPSFMVCPVTMSMKDSKKEEVFVYLPKDTIWYDFHTGERTCDNGFVLANATIDIIPVYVKAGSIIPMIAPLQYVSEKKYTVIYLHVYDGADGMFRFYEDKGDGYDYEQGQYSYTDYYWNDIDKELRICERKGYYNEIETEVTYSIECHTEHGVISKEICYKGEEVKVNFFDE